MPQIQEPAQHMQAVYDTRHVLSIVQVNQLKVEVGRKVEFTEGPEEMVGVVGVTRSEGSQALRVMDPLHHARAKVLCQFGQDDAILQPCLEFPHGTIQARPQH